MNKIEAWYWGNIELIGEQLPKAQIAYDDVNCQWLCIDRFPLPNNVQQDYSKLLIVTPGLDQPISIRPNAFYLDLNLMHRSGRKLSHVYNKGAYHGCQDLSKEGFAWFCLHLNRWEPSYNVVDGDNYATVINTIYKELNTL